MLQPLRLGPCGADEIVPPLSRGARLGNAKHETTIGHVEEVAVFEQVAANFQAAGCASAFSERPP